jgi:hypothetical protein
LHFASESTAAAACRHPSAAIQDSDGATLVIDKIRSQ